MILMYAYVMLLLSVLSAFAGDRLTGRPAGSMKRSEALAMIKKQHDDHREFVAAMDRKKEELRNRLPVQTPAVPVSENMQARSVPVSSIAAQEKANEKKKKRRKRKPAGIENKKYACPMCPRVFTRKGDLLNHITTHNLSGPVALINQVP